MRLWRFVPCYMIGLKRKMVKLKAKQFRQLQTTCTDCIIQGKKTFILSCPNALQWPEGFPKGVRLSDGYSEWQINKQEIVRRRLRASLVLNWLYEHEYSSYDYTMLLKQIQAVDMQVVGLLNIRDLHLIEGVRERNKKVVDNILEE